MEERFETLGDFCKSLETVEAGRAAVKGKPLIVRLDGRSFHTFTKDLDKPFDVGLMALMKKTSEALVNEFNPLLAYAQSDEISLVWWFPEDTLSDYPFAGRFQKMCSVTAGFASAVFCKHLASYLPQKMDQTPHFDCRAWQVDSLVDAAKVIVWREFDARKNSVSMVAQSVFSHKQLHGRDTLAKIMMLMERGIDWSNFPSHLRRGFFFRRVLIERTLTETERLAIPEKHRPAPDTLVKRHRVDTITLPPLHRITNLVDALFFGAVPVEKELTEL
jgi:tRNA(His) guanylyltransferase